MRFRIMRMVRFFLLWEKYLYSLRLPLAASSPLSPHFNQESEIRRLTSRPPLPKEYSRYRISSSDSGFLMIVPSPSWSFLSMLLLAFHDGTALSSSQAIFQLFQPFPDDCSTRITTMIHSAKMLMMLTHGLNCWWSQESEKSWRKKLCSCCIWNGISWRVFHDPRGSWSSSSWSPENETLRGQETSWAFGKVAHPFHPFV